jgi:hypothetical protein
MTVVDKDIPSNRKLLGQFLTPLDVAQFCVDRIDTDADLIVEPSCGEGVFLDLLRKKFPEAHIIGNELDPDLMANYQGEEHILNQNFYDMKSLPPARKVAFVGNPPYRSPALSLKTHNAYMNMLRNEANIGGVREEAVLFILHTFYLAESLGYDCEAHYILPRAIFQNNSKVFTKFANLLNEKFGVRAVYDLGKTFDSVSRNLVFVSMTKGPKSKTINVNDEPREDWLGAGADIIPFQKIFKKTYLGSVPCESIFLSCANESKEEFKNRLAHLFNTEVNTNNIVDLLSYKGEPHLRALKKRSVEKVNVVLDYIKEAKKLVALEDFSNSVYYQPIRHRHENRWYFRHNALKKASFVYQINSNPCPSFSFPGNPSSSSKDYFVYCDYDINRNSGPGAQRLVPIENVENNLTDWFKDYWQSNTKLALNLVIDYLQWVGESEWYKTTKKMNERFYFGIPVNFLKEFHAQKSTRSG